MCELSVNDGERGMGLEGKGLLTQSSATAPKAHCWQVQHASAALSMPPFSLGMVVVYLPYAAHLPVTAIHAHVQWSQSLIVMPTLSVQPGTPPFAGTAGTGMGVGSRVTTMPPWHAQHASFPFHTFPVAGLRCSPV